MTCNYPRVARTLAAAGHGVVAAALCAEAMMHSGPSPSPSLDFDLGDGCGTQVARHLLGQGVTGQVVFYTGTTDASQLEEARLLGSVFCKGELGTLRELVRTVNEIVRT